MLLPPAPQHRRPRARLTLIKVGPPAGGMNQDLAQGCQSWRMGVAARQGVCCCVCLARSDTYSGRIGLPVRRVSGRDGSSSIRARAFKTGLEYDLGCCSECLAGTERRCTISSGLGVALGHDLPSSRALCLSAILSRRTNRTLAVDDQAMAGPGTNSQDRATAHMSWKVSHFAVGEPLSKRESCRASPVNHRCEKFEYQFHSHVRPASAENARL